MYAVVVVKNGVRRWAPEAPLAATATATSSSSSSKATHKHKHKKEGPEVPGLAPEVQRVYRVALRLKVRHPMWARCFADHIEWDRSRSCAERDSFPLLDARALKTVMQGLRDPALHEHVRLNVQWALERVLKGFNIPRFDLVLSTPKASKSGLECEAEIRLLGYVPGSLSRRSLLKELQLNFLHGISAGGGFHGPERRKMTSQEYKRRQRESERINPWDVLYTQDEAGLLEAVPDGAKLEFVAEKRLGRVPRVHKPGLAGILGRAFDSPKMRTYNVRVPTYKGHRVYRDEITVEVTVKG
jgi:hypothetical protein